MNKLAENSGGHVFYPRSPQEVNQSFASLAEELRTHYMLGFKPVGAVNKRSWHEIRVKLSRETQKKLGKVVLRTRKGFNY